MTLTLDKIMYKIGVKSLAILERAFDAVQSFHTNGSISRAKIRDIKNLAEQIMQLCEETVP